MNRNEAVEHVKSAPNTEAAEAEFSINFTKACEKASVYTSISSMCKRLLTHTDFNLISVFTYNKNNSTWRRKELSEFDPDEEIIFGCRGKIPIESLKIQSNPRSARSYAQVISPQNEVDFDE